MQPKIQKRGRKPPKIPQAEIVSSQLPQEEGVVTPRK
jgi:hypothetical protein